MVLSAELQCIETELGLYLQHGEDDISEFVEFKKITKYEKKNYIVELHENITMTILRDSYMQQTN